MLDKQFCSLKISQQQLETYLEKTGYWGTPYLRERNQFVMSPCAYYVSTAQQNELAVIGKEIYAALGRIAQQIYSISVKKPRNRDEQELIGIATRSSKKLLTPEDTVDSSIPPVIKVDMVQDLNGNYFVVEVDAYNPRGLGFNALLDGKALLSHKECKTYGTIAVLAQLILQFNSAGTVTYIVSEHERYYEPSFQILQQELGKFGVDMVLVRERDCKDAAKVIDQITCRTKGCVFMIPESLEDPELRSALLSGYKDHSLQFFFPPKAYLGSKLLLPYMNSHKQVNGFIPSTVLMSKYHDIEKMNFNGEMVLKAGQSSGMKGVLFSDLNPEEFKKCFAEESKKKRPSWVLQRHVSQKSLSLEVFDRGNTRFQDYYLRIIAQFSANGVIGLDITGRPDRMVHGAPDCVMIPAILA